MISLQLGRTEDGKCVIYFGTAGPFDRVTELLTSAPELLTPACAGELARAVNHVAHGSDFAVIVDPNCFAQDYMSRIEGEDPNAEWEEYVVRLRDFGVPDFGSIEPPTLDGGTLTYHAVGTYLGVPYKAEVRDFALVPVYEAVSLKPLPRPPKRDPGSAGDEAGRDDEATTPPGFEWA